MQHNTGNDDPCIIETNQDEDTSEQIALGSRATVRLVSTRCREGQEQSLPCQDYAALISNAQGTSFSFCVCDGVGSSYKGNFAARYLAGCLVSWLQKLPALPRRGEKLIRPLHTRLNQWAREAQQALNDFAIAPDAPELVREVLAELRQSHGSETVFFCARIDSVVPAAPRRDGRDKSAPTQCRALRRGRFIAPRYPSYVCSASLLPCWCIRATQPRMKPTFQRSVHVTSRTCCTMKS